MPFSLMDPHAPCFSVWMCSCRDRQTDSSGWGFESNLTHVRQALDLILIIHFHIVNHDISTAKPIESSSDKQLLSNSLGFFTVSKSSVMLKEDFQENMTGVIWMPLRWREKDLLNQEVKRAVFNGLGRFRV